MNKHILLYIVNIIIFLLLNSNTSSAFYISKDSSAVSEIIQRYNPQKTMAEMVKSRAISLLELHKQNKMTLKLGRQELLNEMSLFPKQLGLDLIRTPVVMIGDYITTFDSRRGLTQEQQFFLTAKLLSNYVRRYRPELYDKNHPGRLGKFYLTEIIYGISQNWSAPALAMAHEDTVLKSAEWGTRPGTAEQRASFSLEPMHEAILTVSFVSERIMTHYLDKRNKDFSLIIESKLYFDLAKGEVTYLYSYSADGTGRAIIH